MRDLSQRAHAVRTVSAACLLTLTRPDGNSVRLDGAIALSLPQRSVRIRAWKFDQPVFDLTLSGGELWIEGPRDERRRQQVVPAGASAGQLARALSVFGGDVFDGPEVRVLDAGGPWFEVRKPIGAGQTLMARVERATLTVRAYRLADENDVTRFTLTPSAYQDFGGIRWPTRMLARSEFGTIDAELRDVEINAELPPVAFVHPARAEKAP